MKLPCSGLVLSTEVRYLRMWKKANHLFLFQTSTLDVGQCVYGSTIHTAQQSGNSSGKVAFNPSIFSQVFRRLKHLLMK